MAFEFPTSAESVVKMSQSSKKGRQTTKVKAYDESGNYIGMIDKPVAVEADDFSTSGSDVGGLKSKLKAKSSDLIGNLIGKAGKVSASQPAKNGKQDLNVDTSIVDLLKSRGEDSSYGTRSKMAADMGIDGYKGTAKQNSLLLRAVKAHPKTKSKPEPSDEPLPGLGKDVMVDSSDDDLMDQNSESVEPGDMHDGTWSDYVKYAKKQSGDAMSFSMYKRKFKSGLV